MAAVAQRSQVKRTFPVNGSIAHPSWQRVQAVGWQARQAVPAGTTHVSRGWPLATHMRALVHMRQAATWSGGMCRLGGHLGLSIGAGCGHGLSPWHRSCQPPGQCLEAGIPIPHSESWRRQYHQCNLFASSGTHHQIWSMRSTAAKEGWGWGSGEGVVGWGSGGTSSARLGCGWRVGMEGEGMSGEPAWRGTEAVAQHSQAKRTLP